MCAVFINSIFSENRRSKKYPTLGHFYITLLRARYSYSENNELVSGVECGLGKVRQSGVFKRPIWGFNKLLGVKQSSGCLMELELKKIEAEEIPQTFELFKQYMRPVIEVAFGWDEEFQESGFKSRLLPDWFSWIVVNNETVGLVCFKKQEYSLYIHLLIIFSEHQRNGVGKLVTEHLRRHAEEEGGELTLSCFKNNDPALNLYKKLKFETVAEDRYFYHLSSGEVST